MKRVVGSLLLLVTLVVGTSTAFAAWTPGSAGSGTSSARAIGVPTAPSATPLGSSAIHITWAAPSAPTVGPTGYSCAVPRRSRRPLASSRLRRCRVTTPVSRRARRTPTRSRRASARTGGARPTAGFSATTTGVPTVSVAVPPTTRTAGVSFAVVMTATTNGVTVDSSYTGTKTITFSGPGSSPSGAAPVYPATVNFVAGVGTATVTLVRAETVSLQATDGTRVGATSVTVAAATAARLGYTGSTPSCAAGSVIVGNGGTFTSFVTLFDTYGNPATASVAQVIALASAPSGTGTLTPTSLTVPAGSSQTSETFSFKLPVGNPPDVAGHGVFGITDAGAVRREEELSGQVAGCGGANDTRFGNGELGPALARSRRQLVHERDRVGVVVAGAGLDRTVGEHALHELTAGVRAHDRQRPVVVLADAAGGDVGVLGREVGAHLAALTRPLVALLQRHLVVRAVVHPDLEHALDVHLLDVGLLAGRTSLRRAPRRSRRRTSSSRAGRC